VSEVLLRAANVVPGNREKSPPRNYGKKTENFEICRGINNWNSTKRNSKKIKQV